MIHFWRMICGKSTAVIWNRLFFHEREGKNKMSLLPLDFVTFAYNALEKLEITALYQPKDELNIKDR